MSKKSIVGVIFSLVGTILFFGSFKMLPDLEPLGASLAIIFLGIFLFLPSLLNKKWNKRMIVGIILSFVGTISAFATIERLPDFKPLISMSLTALTGLSLFIWGLLQAKTEKLIKKTNYLTLFGLVVAVGLFFIALILFPQINWQHPKDPASVMILCVVSSLLLFYSFISNHPARKPMIIAGLIAIINFCLDAFSFL